MNQKKSTKILIILIVVVLITILLGGFVFAYLATDIFRSEKDLFFKYIIQIGDSEKGFIDNQLKEYLEKRKNTPYKDEGKFFANITSSTNQEQFKNINNFDISFSGQVDSTNAKAEQNISLNYSDEVNFPINYKQIGNTIGLQTKYVGNKFIAIETNNLANITDGYISLPEMDINDIEKIELTDEQKTHIKNTYMEVLSSQLGEEKFSKVKEVDFDGYKLTLTGEDLKNILIQLLETLKNDETTLDIINQYLGIQEKSGKVTTSDIEDLIETINDEKFNEQNIEIIVYSKKGRTNKVTISTNELKIDIQKENSQGNIKYNVLIELTQDGDTAKVYFNTTFSGISSMQNINELYELVMESEELQYKYILENNINFIDSVNIEELTSKNSMILTDYTSEQVSNFLNAVVERITQVNKEQMEELGLEESENPIQYLIPSLDMLSMSGNWINQTTLSEEEINTFNTKFENYEGTNQQAQTVKGLLSTILRSNGEEENEDMKITEINLNGEEYEATEENISLIKENVNMEKNYKIEFEKDSDTGLIYRVIINEK